jgi:hypothetical protein
MNQPIELQNIGDLSQYMSNINTKAGKLYLYVFKKSGDYYGNAAMDRTVHIDAGTMHIGHPLDISIKNRNNVFYGNINKKLGWTLSQETGWSVDPLVKLDIGDSIVLPYTVYYELRPGAAIFENKKHSHMHVRPIMFEEVRVFDIGDIGYELRDMTPEQAAEKYFGVSDFRQLFSNYAAASKQMSLTPRERRSFGMAPLALTGMHPVKPSSFQEYVNAGKGLLSGKHPVGPSSRFLLPASVLASLTSLALTRSGRPLSGLALTPLPLLGEIHSRIREQQQLNQLQRTKTVALSNEEREKLLAKGALSSELTRRLTTPNSRDFAHTHRRVHQKPTSARIHWSQKRRGGRKIRRTIKK